MYGDYMCVCVNECVCFCVFCMQTTIADFVINIYI